MKRGPKPKSIVNQKWSPNLAYAIGLLTTDGCLSSDGLLVDMTSSDKEQLQNYLKCLGVKIKIGTKSAGKGRSSFRVQLKNRIFYDFLLSIGLTPKKSLTLGKISIPEEYFFDFLRGCFDGDGCSYSYWDPRWRSSFMFYVSFASGSKKFPVWLQEEVYKRLKIKSHISVSINKKTPYYQLKYSKYAGIKLVESMYNEEDTACLTRKRLKINKVLAIVDNVNARVGKLVDPVP